MTKEDVLKLTKAGEVLLAMQKYSISDPEVDAYFNFLAYEEFKDRIGPDFDPDIIYEIGIR